MKNGDIISSQERALPLVSIFTCVYNRADKIHRVFSSVNHQTYPNIEHIIVDDGSTDGVESLIRDYMETAKYPVQFVAKENGGKHTATNLAWDLARGEYIVQLDSDDALLPHAVEYLVGLWDEIPEQARDSYWCVHGRCCTQHDRSQVVGDLYPEGINLLPEEEAKAAAAAVAGEKIGLMRRDILNQGYRYPQPVGVKFVQEGVLWKPLDRKYRTWYTNEIVRVYYVDEGECLSNPGLSRQTLTNRCWNAGWRLRHRAQYPCNMKRDILKYALYYPQAVRDYRTHNPYRLCSFRDDPLVWSLLLLLWIPSRLVSPFLLSILKRITK